ncbi:MAG: hypothetical protein F9K25_01520 [Candidatus Contendobacter sp.]|nr:MAG: hypothetical protein F9K25_01520 [Candidatus Contendobacter sp.]
MRHRAALPAQRIRRFLSQEALKRSHRRCDLIRIAPEDESTASSSHAVDAAELADPSAPASLRA